MTWFRSVGVFEIAVIAAFVAFYLLFILRVIRIGKVLNTSASNVWIKTSLRLAILALMIIASLGPSFGDAKKEVKSVGKDILFCVDLSKSMDAFDIQPTRLEKIKFEMKRIVEAFNSDRIGIIIFSSEAFMQCPLTFDQNALFLFIETMNTGLVPSSGTDFAPPLRMALNKFKNDTGSSNQQKSSVVILISDGEDFGEETDEVRQEIADSNIRLFTLGIGTQKGSPIYATRGYKTDKDGNTVISKLNDQSLKALASRTDGRYYAIDENQNEVSKLIHDISQIEGELRGTRFVDITANRYSYFLAAALFLLAVEVLVNVKTVRV